MKTSLVRRLLIACVGLGLSTVVSAQEINRMEPLNWWTGMKNPRVQLMLYGKDLGGVRASIDYPGVRLERAIQVASPNYLFLDLYISQEAKPGDVLIAFPGSDLEPIEFPLWERESGSRNREGFNSSDVIYLITPDRFVNGDPSNDEVEGLLEKPDRAFHGGRHGGDLAGIAQSLPYLEEMGFTAIWLNPVLENNMETYSYHGYSTTDYYRVDPRFGTNQAYRQLAESARDHGIKLIMDMIANHCGSNHWWMADPPSSDWLNFQDSPPNKKTTHRRESIQDPYASNYDKRMNSDGWFVQTMPDLNQRNPLMATYLIQNSIWWIEYAQLGGIRQDTYSYPDKEFMSKWARSIMEEYPNFNIVGEEWTTNPSIVSYWQRGKVNHDGYVSYLPSLMDFPLQHALAQALDQEDGNPWENDLTPLYRVLANDFVYPDPDNLVVFPDNHDMSRFFTQVNENFEAFKMGLTYLSVVRGIPQFFYGTEVLMKNPGTRAHGIIRSDFPGGWPDDEVNAFTGDGLSDQQKEAQAFVKQLLNWRKTCTTVHEGQLKHFAPIHSNPIYGLFRYDDERVVMLLLNTTDKHQKISWDKYLEEVLEEGMQGKVVIDGGEVVAGDDSIQIQAMTAWLVEFQR